MLSVFCSSSESLETLDGVDGVARRRGSADVLSVFGFSSGSLTAFDEVANRLEGWNGFAAALVGDGAPNWVDAAGALIEGVAAVDKLVAPKMEPEDGVDCGAGLTPKSGLAGV